METKTFTPKIKTPSSLPDPGFQAKPQSWIRWLFLAGIAVFAAINWDDYVVERNGELELAPKRKAKLEKELEQIDNAMQYALIAKEDGFFPCFTCDNTSLIYLHRGEVWKYGTTRLGEEIG